MSATDDLASAQWRAGDGKGLARFLAAQQRRVAGDVDETLDHLDVRPDDVVVDVGCGLGATAQRASERHPSARVVGVDRSPVLLSRAQSTSASVSWICGDAAALPCVDSSVDRLISERLLLHVLDLEAVLTEFRRILRREGRAVLVEPTWSRFVFRGGDPVLDATLAKHLQDGVAAPRIGTVLPQALAKQRFHVVSAEWLEVAVPIDANRFTDLAREAADHLPEARVREWIAGWDAPDRHTTSWVRRITAQPVA